MNPPQCPRQQQGIMLLVIVTILLLGGVSILLTVLTNNNVNQQRNDRTLAALVEAKDRLLSYSVLYGDYYGDNDAGPGHLPCPDTDGDGLEDAPCAAGAFGRLPQSLVLPSGAVYPLSSYDSGNDQQFWYALSDDYRRNPVAIANSLSGTSLTIDGQGGWVAVLLAPGEPLTGQARPSNNSIDYLDAGNDGGQDFVSSAAGDFNDMVMGISFGELMSTVTVRVAERILLSLQDYHDNRGNFPPNQAQFSNALLGAGGGGPGGGGPPGGGGGGGGTLTMPQWYEDNDWFANTVYNPLTGDSATIAFNGCNIIFTLNAGALDIPKSSFQC